jgi:hypothetical protein
MNSYKSEQIDTTQNERMGKQALSSYRKQAVKGVLMVFSGDIFPVQNGDTFAILARHNQSRKAFA